MLKKTTRAGLEKQYGPRPVGAVLLDVLAHSKENLYSSIRQLVAEGGLPHFVRHLGTLDFNSGKEVVAL